MCIIIYKPAKSRLKKEVLEICHMNNPNGMGLMYAEKDQVIIHKELVDFEAFWAIADQAQTEKRRKMIVHFRMATHGSVSLNNCHPFYVRDGLGAESIAFCHNGIFSGFGSKSMPGRKDDISDTRAFNEAILKNLPKDFLHNQAIMRLIANVAGTDKLAFMNGQGKVFIINAQKGVWDDDDKLWYSNNGYMDVFGLRFGDEVWPFWGKLNRHQWIDKPNEPAKTNPNTDANFDFDDELDEDKDKFNVSGYCDGCLQYDYLTTIEFKSDDFVYNICFDCYMRLS